MPRKKLADILRQDNGEGLRRAWDLATPAEDFAPLPPGEYVAQVIAGELINAKKNGTPGYKLTFEVVEGDHFRRRVWHDIWLTPAALPMAKRDLAKVGILSLDQLEQPLPEGIRCRVKLALRHDDDGNDRNRVIRFELVGIDSPQPDPFAPTESPEPADGDSIPSNEASPS